MKNRNANTRNSAKMLKKEKLRLKENVSSILKNLMNKLPLKKERKQRLELRKNGVMGKLPISVTQTYLK
ncbi:MAG: hypothetical protein VZR53_00295 [Prevotella sp.]|nr:hypothetical protein [Prevotella sp.]